MGLATPGHIAADPDSGFVLVLAQQSIREMTRTERTAQQVMDEAVFGAFEVGYDRGFGSDADHLKTPADVDVTAEAGFTGFTIDPSDYVDDTVDRASPAELAERFRRLRYGIEFRKRRSFCRRRWRRCASAGGCCAGARS